MCPNAFKVESESLRGTLNLIQNKGSMKSSIKRRLERKVQILRHAPTLMQTQVKLKNLPEFNNQR